MKRVIEIDDSQLLSEPVKRIRFLTPYKVVLLYMIYEFCRFSMFHSGIIPKAVVYLVQQVTKTRTEYEEPTLQEIYDTLLTFEDPPENEQLVQVLEIKLLGISHPASLYEFMKSLDDIVEDKGQIGEITVLDGASVFGMFVRRCRIEYFQSCMDEIANLFEAYRAYITQTADDRQLNRMLIINDTTSHHEMSAYAADTTIAANSSMVSMAGSSMSQDPLGLDDSYKLGGWLCDQQVDTFLTQQAEMIEKTGASDIPPAILHQYLDYLQRHAPGLVKIYQVRFLNYIRTAEYEGAVSNLKRFFDYCFLYRKAPMYHYALLNLGILEAKFGHTQQSLYALEEAVKVAREYQDEECLNEVHSWIYYVKGTLNDHSRLLDTLEITTSENSVKNENSIYLQSIYKLSQVQDMIKSGGLPSKVFQTLFQCNIQPSLHGIGYLSLPYSMIKFATWSHYGNAILAKTFLDMALQEKEGTVNDKEKLCLLASNSYFNLGNYTKAMKILQNFAEEYPDQTAMSLEWKQAYIRVQSQLYPDEPLTNGLEGQIKQLDLLQPERRQSYFEALHQQAEDYVKAEDYETALRILEDVYRTFKETDHISLSARNLILRAQIHMDSEQVEKAIELLLESLIICKNAHDAHNYYKTVIKLANAYLTYDNDPIKALYLLEYSIPNILSLQTLDVEDEMKTVYTRALNAQECGI